MSAAALRQYQRQAVQTASPAALVEKLYAVGAQAARAGDGFRTRRALVELAGAVDRDRGGEIADRLLALYEFSIRATAEGDLDTVAEILDGLRDAWRRATLAPLAVAAEA